MLHQVTSGYVRLCQFTSEGRDVELDNSFCDRCGGWSIEDVTRKIVELKFDI